MSEHEGYQLQVEALPERIARVRHEIGAAAARLGLRERSILDLQIIVSEACANVVNYAYREGTEGSIDVELAREDATLLLTVRDQGGGIRPRPESDIPGLKMGLPVIGALSRRFRITSELGLGTKLEVELPFDPAPG